FPAGDCRFGGQLRRSEEAANREHAREDVLVADDVGRVRLEAADQWLVVHHVVTHGDVVVGPDQLETDRQVTNRGPVGPGTGANQAIVPVTGAGVGDVDTCDRQRT